MGANEKLLGDFIKKHNVRDKVFGEYSPNALHQCAKEELTRVPSCVQVRIRRLCPYPHRH